MPACVSTSNRGSQVRTALSRHGLPELRREQHPWVGWGTLPGPARGRRQPIPAGQRKTEDRQLRYLLTAICCYLLLVFASPAFAQLDFELAGGEVGAEQGFLRLSTLPPKPTLINFWRSDCPPCLRELPLLNRYAAEHPEIRVVTIALQKPSETSVAPVKPQAPVIALHGPSQPQGLLARYGNRIGALPFTVLLTAERKSCARSTGEVSEDWLKAQHSRCLPERTAEAR